jgi:hypothetical protein
MEGMDVAALEREKQMATRGVIDALIPFKYKRLCLAALESASKEVRSNHVLFPLGDEGNNSSSNVSS